MGNASSLIAYRRWNRLICSAIWFSRLTILRKKQLKAFCSLEAYNQMVSGFVCNVQEHIIADKLVVLEKVRYSERINDALIQI